MFSAEDSVDAEFSAPAYWLLREMRIPSLCIRDCSVERFIPSRAAAPFGPAIVQFVCSSARRICWRAVLSRTARMLLALAGDGLAAASP